MLAHYSKSLHHPYFNHLVVLAAYRISKGNAGAGRLSKKNMSVCDHGEGEDGKRETVERATDLQCPQKTLSRVLIHENGDRNIY